MKSLKRILLAHGVFILFSPGLILSSANAQKKAVVANDVTTPLHAMQPDYPVPYKSMSQPEIKSWLDKIFNYLDAVTPARMINKATGKEITDIAKLDTNTIIEQKDFRLTSYEWGVTYSAMLRAAETTGDKKYAGYVKKRFDFLAKWIPAVKEKFPLDYIRRNNLFVQPISPHALDDAGAVCAAMIKATINGSQNNLRPLIDIYIDFVANKEYRLSDGTLGRLRPQKNTLWLDDMYMGIPSLAQMGKLTGESKYIDDAVKQVKQFVQRMFNEQKGLYMHGWVEGMETHPEFRWGRANGWALLAKAELLDVLPADHPDYNFVMQQFKKHIAGLAQYQSGSGLWHQLLDRNDSYLETSATAIYAYCIAHACNKGWIDPVTYAPMAMLAWNGVTTKINAKGQVEGTCVGTGMSFEPLFYYHRPVNVFAAHGYGPVILAGAEMYQLVGKNSFKINDSSLQYYKE
ncbi:MAG: glycoside hydrolase family 88/105 protein [Chitinophagaceae bacterium]